MLKKIRIVAFALVPVMLAVYAAVWWLPQQGNPTATDDATGPVAHHHGAVFRDTASTLPRLCVLKIRPR